MDDRDLVVIVGDGMGFLLLLAAAWHTGLITAFLAALPLPAAQPWLRHLLRPTLLRLLLTLLFLCAVGLRRTWDLRGYTGTALAFLTGRLQAYGYHIVEQFLRQLAQADADGALTDALARWTQQLWMAPTSAGGDPSISAIPPAPPVSLMEPMSNDRPRQVVYIDSHRKPVYSDVLLPRGLIGRTGKILGCRTLVLLHDAQGHVLLPLTTRGDAHLTTEAPRILERYTQATNQPLHAAVVIDREGMGASFLLTMALAGHTVLTCLRADQYSGVESFTDVGTFVPLTTDADGQVIRAVAAARLVLTVPEREAVDLPLRVALIRDHRWQVPIPTTTGAVDWCADLEDEAAMWWDDAWVAPAAPPVPTQPKLIALVSTDLTLTPQQMVQLYTARWPCQENVIKDWLLPLGIDVNHGYGKTEVANSELAKQRAELDQRDQTLHQRISSARKRLQDAITRKLKVQQARHAQAAAILEGEAAEDDARWARQDAQLRRAITAIDREQQQLEGYCRDQRVVRRQIADLDAQDRPMYVLDNRKDQVMTVMKVAVVNLAMWVRDQYFPDSFAQATWTRLRPFFQVGGRIHREAGQIRVQLQPFNDRALNRDLQIVCAKVAARAPTLPDGRRLVLDIQPARRPGSDQHMRC